MALLDRTPQEVVVLHSVTGHVHYVSHNAASALQGIGIAIGSNIITVVDAGFEEQVRGTIQKVAGKQPAPEPARTTVLVSSAVGACWLHYTTTCVRDKQGDLIELHTVIKNVSEYVELAKEMRDYEDASSISQELSHVGIWSFSPSTQKVTLSEGLKRIYEFEEHHEITAESTLALFKADSVESIQRTMQAVRADHMPRVIDVEGHTVNGRPIWIRMCLAIDRGSSGEEKIYGASRDITDHVLRQQNLEQTVQNLVSQRNRLDEFGDLVSHSLKISVSNLNALSLLLGKKSSLEENDELIESVRTTIESLNHTIHEVADSVQVRLSEKPVPTHVYLSDVLLKVRMRLSSRIRDTHVTIEQLYESNAAVYYPAQYLESIYQQFISSLLHDVHAHSNPSIEISQTEKNGHAFVNFLGRGVNGLVARVYTSIQDRTTLPVSSTNSCCVGLFAIRTLLESSGGGGSVSVNADGEVKIEIDLGPGSADGSADHASTHRNDSHKLIIASSIT